jgi:hypothetical protein
MKEDIIQLKRLANEGWHSKMTEDQYLVTMANEGRVLAIYISWH